MRNKPLKGLMQKQSPLKHGDGSWKEKTKKMDGSKTGEYKPKTKKMKPQ